MRLLSKCAQLRAFSAWLPPGVLRLNTTPLPNLAQICLVLFNPGDIQSIYDHCKNLKDLWIRRKPEFFTPQVCIRKLNDLSQALAHLKSLFISRINLHHEEFIPTLASLHDLIHLELLYAGLDDSDLHDVAHALPHLRVLGLCGNLGISTRGLAHLSKYVRGLTKLDIMATRMDSELDTFRMLRAPDVFPELHVLYVLEWPRTWRREFARTRSGTTVVDYLQWRRRHGLDEHG